MKQSPSFLRSICMLAIMALGFALIVATGDSDSSNPTTPPGPQPALPPDVSIINPQTASLFQETDTITFVAQATDSIDGPLSGVALKWYSSREDYLGFGSSLTNVEFRKTGTHTITLIAENRQGVKNTASIDIAINPYNNTPPTASIVQPADGESFQLGSLIVFHGEGNDTEDGPLSGAQLVWTSSKDKQIGTGPSFTSTSLSSGTHTITLVAKDSQDIPSRPAYVTIHINNTPPVAEIQSPADGSTFSVQHSILFRGRALDAEEGYLQSDQLQWYSTIDGNLGTGQTFHKNNLSPGIHTISLVATDKDGATDMDEIQLTITP
ncbi:hypothetical protein OOT00_07455 [Desulfobotulus sp. H1]|uniref:PKD/Chitinase domain-containing protein n=1 Tax=Desulfobotulus pelophilus TaxID=2823377 RepID=A0ABT3N8N2_9BACT|nr:hypothetical protein [Desulfobotulus pelophilus]MCW7753816.1 hypothetical protein [Desulfobotulus pelophilus]